MTDEGTATVFGRGAPHIEEGADVHDFAVAPTQPDEPAINELAADEQVPDPGAVAMFEQAEGFKEHLIEHQVAQHSRRCYWCTITRADSK